MSSSDNVDWEAYERKIREGGIRILGAHREWPGFWGGFAGGDKGPGKSVCVIHTGRLSGPREFSLSHGYGTSKDAKGLRIHPEDLDMLLEFARVQGAEDLEDTSVNRSPSLTSQAQGGPKTEGPVRVTSRAKA